MKTVILCVAAWLLSVFPLNAELTPSAEKSCEWTEEHPDGVVIYNSDRFIEYTRSGKIVLRSIKRSVRAGLKGKPVPPLEKNPGVTHIFEFLAGAKIFAVCRLPAIGEEPEWNLICSAPVLFTSKPGDETYERKVYVCVPAFGYFEGLVISKAEARTMFKTNDDYERHKAATMMGLTDIGYIYKVGEPGSTKPAPITLGE